VRKNKPILAKGQNAAGRRVAGREWKRGECQTQLGLVWRETGAVRNARPRRGQAASTRRRRSGEKKRSRLEVGAMFVAP